MEGKHNCIDKVIFELHVLYLYVHVLRWLQRLSQKEILLDM